MMVAPRLVVVTRRSEYELLVREHGTANQARFVLAERGRSFAALERLHAANEDAVATVLSGAPKAWRRVRIDREDLTSFLFEPGDVVACVGQDGVVANAARYVGEHYVLGVNPDPASYEGVLVRLSPAAARERVEAAAARAVPVERRTMAAAMLDDGRAIAALNDIFIGHRSHQSARYSLKAGDREERQSSSGVVIATGAGATGWALSIDRERREPLELPKPTDAALAFFVREAWPGRGFGASITAGRVAAGATLEVRSEMPDSGVIFADGIEAGYLEFPWGSSAGVAVAARTLNLVAA
jgi:NAD kinase